MRKKITTKKTNKYKQAIIICHGQSEYFLSQHLCSLLRLSVVTYAEQNGKSSIQINSINRCLYNKIFATKGNLLKHYSIKTNKNTINPNFKIFIIMDTDDEELTERDIKNFKNKSMFKDHWAYDYIVPIFNTRNLEDVLLKAKIIDKIFENKNMYAKIFPINRNSSVEDAEQVRNMLKTLQPIINTNMDNLLEYLLKLYKN